MDTLFSTREEWLTSALAELRPVFDANGLTLPDRIRVTCGFPSTASRSGAVGQAWASTASADQHFEILISPVLDDRTEVLATLIHEAVHTIPGCMNHGRPFGSAAHRMGLVQGKREWRDSVAGPTFGQTYDALIESLGAYPHAALSMGDRKKQATRLLKAQCGVCGYTIRLTQKWANVGLPVCTCGGNFHI